MTDELEFTGSILVLQEGESVVLSMGSQEIELDLEEAAVLTYQLQLTLKRIQEDTMTRAIKGAADVR